MDLAGYRGGIPRRPLLPLTASQREELQSALSTEAMLP